MRRRHPLAGGIFFAALALPAFAGDLDFYRDIYPILKTNCISCHNKTTTKAGLNMETPALMRKGGDSGEGVIPGKSKESLVVQAAIHTEDLTMPPKNNKTGAVNLTPAEIALLSTWVDQGAHDSVKQARQVAWQGLPAGVDAIYSAALTGDGRYAACARANQVCLYDLATQQPLGRLLDGKDSAHRALVETLAFSPDGQRLASGSFREVKIWHQTSTPPPALKLPATVLAAAPKLLSISPDRTRVCLLGPDETVSIWQLSDGQKLAASEPLKAVRALAWAPDGKSLATGGTEGSAQIWPADLKEPKTLPAIGAAVTALAFVDASQLLIASEDGKVRRMVLPEGKVSTTYEIPGAVALACTPDGARLAAGLKTGGVQVWSLQDAKLETQMHGDLASQEHRAELGWTVAAQGLEVAFQTRESTRLEAENKALDELVKKTKEAAESAAKALPEKQKAAQAATAAREEVDKPLQVLLETIVEPDDEAALAKEIEALQAKLTTLKSVERMAATAATALDDHRRDAQTEIERIDAGKDRNTATLAEVQAALAKAKEAQQKATTELTALDQAIAKGGATPAAVAFSEDGHFLATVSDDGTARAWALATARPTAQAPLGKPSAVAALVAAPEGAFLAASLEGAASLNPLPHWTLERTLGGQPDSPFTDRVEAVRFSPDGKTLAVGGGEPSRAGDISLWEVATGKLQARWDERHTDTVCSLDFSPDGKYLVSGGADKLARLTEIATGKQIRTYEGHTHHVLGVSFRADGRVLATGGGDGVVLIWDVATGERQKKIEGWTKEVTSLQYLGATSQIVTSGGDNLVRIVSDEGAEIRTIPKLPDFMQAAAGSPAAAVIIGGGEDSALHVWDSNTGKELAAFKAD